MNKFTLRPGYLVVLSSRVQGGVSYARTDLEEKAGFARWETTKTVDDPVEREAAEKCRGKARSLIVRECSNTAFGLICAEADEAELDLAEEKARFLCDDFNKTARFSRVSIRVLRGRIEQNDAKAAKAIVGEMSSLIEEMNQGIRTADPEMIRDAMSKAKQMSSILSAEKSEAVAAAVAAAKKAADMLSKRVLKNGEDAAKVIAEIQIGDLEKARMAFLDLGDDAVVEEMPAVARAVEVDTESVAPVTEMSTAPATQKIEYDQTEVEAAETRKDFDAVDVPEVTPKASDALAGYWLDLSDEATSADGTVFTPNAIAEIMANMPSDLQTSIRRALRYESLKPGVLTQIIVNAATQTECVTVLRTLIAELEDEDVPVAPGVAVDMSDAETKAASV